MSITETSHWVLAYAAADGRVSRIHIMVQAPQSFPASPMFWRHCTRLIQGQAPGAELIALTPLDGPLEPEV